MNPKNNPYETILYNFFNIFALIFQYIFINFRNPVSRTLAM